MYLWPDSIRVLLSLNWYCFSLPCTTVNLCIRSPVLAAHMHRFPAQPTTRCLHNDHTQKEFQNYCVVKSMQSKAFVQNHSYWVIYKTTSTRALSSTKPSARCMAFKLATCFNSCMQKRGQLKGWGQGQTGMRLMLYLHSSVIQDGSTAHSR